MKCKGARVNAYHHSLIYSKIFFECQIARQCVKHWDITVGKTFLPSWSLQDSWRETEKSISSYNKLSAMLRASSRYCGRNSFIHSFSKYLCAKLSGYNGELNKQGKYPNGVYRLVEQTDTN